MDQLLRIARPATEPGGLPVIALAHNEANLVRAFLDHYRALGPSHFLIVDDSSTDGTADLLEAAPDVTLLTPAPGTSYAEHKHLWRQALLDRHAPDRWALLPDLDEHFVFAGMEGTPLSRHLHTLDAEGAEAVLTVMIDMYADRPLSDHLFDGRMPLRNAFPLFDGPDSAPFGYHLLWGSAKTRRKAPTPPLSVHGGLRDRLFRHPQAGTPVRLMLDRIAGLDGPVAPEGAARLAHALSRRFTRGFFKDALDMHKVALIRWKPGSTFQGAHRLRQPYRMSESIAAMLHYKFTRGVAGLEYVAQRGQHFGGSRHYRDMLSSQEVLARSPVYAGTRRYEDSASLAGIVRGVPPRKATP